MLKLPKRFHPDFSNPKIKPKGPVEIDRENPLSDGLVAYHLFNTLGSDVIDLAGTRNLKIVNAVHKDDYYGRSLDYSPSVSYAHASTKVFNDYPFTVIAIVDLRNISTSEQVIVCNTRIAMADEWGFVIQLHPNGMAGKLFPRVVVRNPSFYPITGTTDVIASPGIYSIALVAKSATDRKLYVNGILDGSDTLSSPFLTSADTLQTGYLARNNSLTAVSPFDGKILNIAYYAKALTGSDIYHLNIAPYNILKPSSGVYYFPSTASGPITYDVAFSLGLSNSVVNSGQATAQGGITLAQSVGVDESSLANAQSAMSLASQYGATFSGAVAFNVDMTISSNLGVSSSGNATASALLPVSLGLGQTVSALAQAIASVAFSQSNGIAVNTTGLTFDVSLSLGSSLGVSTLAQITLNGSVTLSGSMGATIAANANTLGSLDLGLQVAIQVAANALAQAGVTIGAITSVTVVGTTVIVGIVTPDDRSYTIEIDNRNFIILAESREYKVT